MESHLLQMRGLKHAGDAEQQDRGESHLLQMRGLKPRWRSYAYFCVVASFTDAWIETV